MRVLGLDFTELKTHINQSVTSDLAKGDQVFEYKVGGASLLLFHRAEDCPEYSGMWYVLWTLDSCVTQLRGFPVPFATPEEALNFQKDLIFGELKTKKKQIIAIEKLLAPFEDKVFN